MPIPLIPIALGVAAWAPRALSAINMAFNATLGTSIAAAAAHKATDGKSTQTILNAAEAVIGEKGVRQAGGAIRDSAKYVGEGVIGVGQTLGERYPSSQGVMNPPVSGVGYIASGVNLALNDPVQNGGVNIRHKPNIATNFSESAQGQVADSQAPESAATVSDPASRQEAKLVVAPEVSR